jgi:hypothetical protein
MDISQIFSAILAGGLAGQLVTLYWSHHAKSHQDFENWLRTERFKAFVELLDLVSATAPRDDYEQWPTKIRIACQKCHLLCPGGNAPPGISESMEKLFQLARQKKHNQVQDHDAWTDEMRDEARNLRIGFSNFLYSENLNAS